MRKNPFLNSNLSLAERKNLRKAKIKIFRDFLDFTADELEVIFDAIQNRVKIILGISWI